jgi:hypothetical protein
MNGSLVRNVTLILIITAFCITNAEAQSDLQDQSFPQNEDCACKNAVDSVKYLIPQYYAEAKKDSIIFIIDAIRTKCKADVFGLTRILMAIESNHFSDSLIDSYFLVRAPNPVFWYHSGCCICQCQITPTLEIESNYAQFVKSIAEKLASQTDSASLDNAICKYISGDSDYLIRELARNKYRGTKLQNQYVEWLKLEKYRLSINNDYQAFYSSICVPVRSSGILRQTIEIGGVTGIDLSARLSGFNIKLYGLGLSFFGGIHYTRAGSPFVEKFGRELGRGNNDLYGCSMGFYPSYKIYSKGRFATDCMVGMGFSMLRISSQGNQHRKASLYPTMYFLGINQKYYYNRNRSRYFGLQVCQNYLTGDWQTGSNLNRRAISITLTYGFLRNSYENDRAMEMHYYDWKGKL